MQRTAFVPALILAAVQPADAARPQKPRLDLRASPRVAFAPVEVRISARLLGGDELEAYYCPSLEWDWGDGRRSRHEADCEPFEAGMEPDRLFTASHVYRSSGEFDVALTVRQANRSVGFATTHVLVLGGP